MFEHRVVIIDHEYARDASSRLSDLRLRPPYLRPGLGSSEDFDLACNRLHACRQVHSRKCLPLQDHLLPNRVIDIGSAELATTPRLFLTGGQKGLHVALSQRSETARRLRR
jgi:hypothetical protein